MKSVLKLMAATAVIVSLHSVANAEGLTVGVSWSNFQEERWKTDEAAIKAASKPPATSTSRPTPRRLPPSSSPTSKA